MLGGAPSKLKRHRKSLEFNELSRETQLAGNSSNLGTCVRISICVGHKAMLRPRTFVRGNEIFGRTERPAPLVAHGRARHFSAPRKPEWPLSPYGRSIAHLPRIFCSTVD